MLAPLILLFLQASPISGPGPPEKPSFIGEAGVSFVQTSGNTISKTFGGGFALSYKHNVWRSDFKGEIIRTRTNDKLSAEKEAISLQVERFFIYHMSLSARLSHYADPFAGINTLDTAELGVLYRPIDTKQSQFTFVGSLARTKDGSALRDERHYTALRTAIAGTRHINNTVKISLDADWLYDFDQSANWKTKIGASVAANLSTIFAVKTSYQFFYVNRPAISKRAGDSTLLVSLVAQWPKKD